MLSAALLRKIWSGVRKRRTPFHIDGAASCDDNAAPDTQSGDLLIRTPLQESGAGLLRKNTAPLTWSRVGRFVFDRHPTG